MALTELLVTPVAFSHTPGNMGARWSAGPQSRLLLQFLVPSEPALALKIPGPP